MASLETMGAGICRGVGNYGLVLHTELTFYL
jgi:hypothetical protein